MELLDPLGINVTARCLHFGIVRVGRARVVVLPVIRGRGFVRLWRRREFVKYVAIALAIGAF
jgi:hypothetical protein